MRRSTAGNVLTERMLDVKSKRCSHESCYSVPSYNIQGSKTAAYCRQRAKEGMVAVFKNHCSYGFWMTRPTSTFGGSTKAVSCRKHAEEGMVVVRSSRFSRKSCSKIPCFNVEGSKNAAYSKHHAHDEVPTAVCAHDTSDLKSGLPISFHARCKVVGCLKSSGWGVEGRQPTHCPEHGRLEDDVVCTVGRASRSNSKPRSPVRAFGDQSFLVKTECAL